MKAIGAFLIAAALCGLAVVTMAAQTSWVDEINNSLSFTAANYPNSNWEPYQHKIRLVHDAVGRGDNQVVKMEMGKWFKMLKDREYGIHPKAADELFRIAVLTTPFDEYKISVPDK